MPNSPPAEHRSNAPAEIRCAVLTVSDTRTESNDRGGGAILELLATSGHTLAARKIVKDEPRELEGAIQGYAQSSGVDALLVTGGTGIAPRDNTVDVVQGLLTKTLPGYGELFRMLSFQEIGAAAMLSRAVGGVIDSTVVLTMPGSPAAVRLAMERLVLPELGHLVAEANKQS